jgi:hypothetical protein
MSIFQIEVQSSNLCRRTIQYLVIAVIRKRHRNEMAENVRIPGGIIFGGSIIWSERGRDGCMYVVYTGEGGSTPWFGGQAYRIKPDLSMEWITFDLAPRKDVGVHVSLEPDAAYVSWMNTDERSFSRVKLPGFEPRDYDKTLPNAVPPVVLPVTPVPVFNGVDADGRKYTTDTKKALEASITALSAKVNTHIASSQVPTGLTQQNVQDIIWNTGTTSDRVFVDLQDPKKGVHTAVEIL